MTLNDLPAPVHAAYDATLEYVRRLLVSIDMLCNVIIGGQPGDTMSYRAAVARANGSRFGCIFCKFLDLFQQNHCSITMASDDHERLLMGEAVYRGQQ